MRSARHLTIMQKCSDSHTRSYFKASWHALNSLAAPQRRDGEKNATPSSQGNRPLSQPGRGVKWVAGGNAPGKRALPTLCPSPRPCGERGDPLWRVDRVSPPATHVAPLRGASDAGPLDSHPGNHALA